jgi:hypothetical protein
MKIAMRVSRGRKVSRILFEGIKTLERLVAIMVGAATAIAIVMTRLSRDFVEI